VAERLGDEEQIIAEGKIFGVMAYLSILCLVPIVYFSTFKMIPIRNFKFQIRHYFR